MDEQRVRERIDAILERACQIELTEEELDQLYGGASPALMLHCATGQHAPLGDGSVRFLRDTVRL